MKRGSIFELNGIPKFQEALPLALQHVVAMIVGCVTPAIIVAGAVGGNSLSAKDRVILIQASLVVSALSTLIQLFPIGKKNGFTLGSGLPMIMGVSFAYVPSMQAIAEGYGISSILGAQIIGGIVAFVMGILVKKIRVFFPPLITGTVAPPSTHCGIVVRSAENFGTIPATPRIAAASPSTQRLITLVVVTIPTF